VLAEATGFALLAAMSPTALLVMAVFLGAENPRRIALLYFVGAVLMTVVMAVTVLLVLRATGLNQPREHTPRYGLRLGLGILALAVAVVMSLRARRTRHAPPSDAPISEGTAREDTASEGTASEGTASEGRPRKPGPVARLTARPRPATAFLAGLLVFTPSASFVAAVQVIATANAATWETVLAVVIVVTLTAAIVWLPLIFYFAAPEATTRALRRANGWLVAHGRKVVIGCLAVAGAALVINGALGI
jgi:Sap, sulfolipid-1-addressing protein